MADPLRRVAMRRPGAILEADPSRWHYTKPVDAALLGEQYDLFVDAIEASGAEIVWLPDYDDDLADSIFTFDPSFVVPDGAVILRMGKALREAEARLHAEFYQAIGVPIVGHIEPPGTVEGGDCFWIDGTTIAVGRGFRTNEAGIQQFRAILEPIGINVEAYDLPYFRGPDSCLHLLSVISPLDANLALVYAPLVPAALFQRLTDAGYLLLEAPADEFESSSGLSLNVLATAPRQCIAIEGFPKTLALMETAGCTVSVFAADDLCLPCEGGPTCLTRPLHRSA